MKMNTLKMSEKTKSKLIYLAEHIPISASICSNVVGFQTPKCHINSDPARPMGEMVKYMLDIQAVSYNKMMAKLEYVFDQIDEKLENECPENACETERDSGDLGGRLFKMMNKSLHIKV